MNKKIEAMKIETEYTEEPICPYCGNEESDAWEIDFGIGLDGDTEIYCSDCGKEYHLSRNVIVSYSSKRLNDD